MASLIIVADLIGSTKLSEGPGGLRNISRPCADMRLFLDRMIDRLDYSRAINRSDLPSRGDDLVYQFDGVSFSELANFTVDIAIHAFCNRPLGTQFRYIIYTVERGQAYSPRIRDFAGLSKTTAGKKYHLALDRGVVSSLTDDKVIAWITDAPKSKTNLKFKGEQWTGVLVDFFCPIASSHVYMPAPTPSDVILAEKTYFRYRDEKVALVDSAELVRHLEKRYSCTAISLGGRLFPVTAIWRNVDQLIDPDVILGELDMTDPSYLASNATLSPDEYLAAREFIRCKFTSGSVKHEGHDYCLIRIDSLSGVPKILGAFGFYYDSVLTQFALEWELKRALLSSGRVGSLATLGTLPLREAVEAAGNPLFEGAGRRAAISISTLLVFKRPTGSFACLIRKRSSDVGISPNMSHVAPAGMFEASNTNDNWSVRLNVWRELLEEVYNEKEQQGSPFSEISDHILRKEPIALLGRLLQQGSAEFSVTGIIVDLLKLQPEICTLLFVRDPSFAEVRQMQLNWEYELQPRTGKFLIDWSRIDEVIQGDALKHEIVPNGAACLTLGRDWMKARHGL